MNPDYPQLPDSAKHWNKALIRNEADIAGTLEEQIGFELTGIKDVLRAFCESHQDGNSLSCTIGLFLYFYKDEDILVDNIGSIEIKKLEAVFESATNDPHEHWLARWNRGNNRIDLTDVNTAAEPDKIKARGWKISHYQDDVDNGNYATSATASYQVPTLRLDDLYTEPSPENGTEARTVSNYSIQTIRGYRESLRIVYLDYGTLMHMFMAYGLPGDKGPSEDELKFIFSGAEINHGEMVSPQFQHERFKDWVENSPTPAFPYLDTSITPTLKIEEVHKVHHTSDQYEGVENHPLHNSIGVEVSLPGVRVLAPCRRFWYVVKQVMDSTVSQKRFNNMATFDAEQKGAIKFKAELDKPYIKKLFGPHFTDI